MPAPPAQPRRTVAIIVLDGFVALVRTVWHALTGRGGSRLAQLAIVGSLGVLAATALSIVAVLRTPERLTPVVLGPGVATTDPAPWPGEQPGPTPSERVAPARPATTFAPSAPARPAGPPRASTPPATSPAATVPAALVAHFATEDSALLGYGATVTIDNPGQGAVEDWKLVVVLPRESLRVTSVRGARAVQEGATWTFVPDGSAGTVPARGSALVTFRVSGGLLSAAPTACTIDGHPCTGLPD